MTDQTAMPPLRHVHFLGIGGVGVSGVARIMLAQRIKVTGTDAKDLPVMKELTDLGATTYVGYRAENIAEAQRDAGQPIDAVIASTIAGPGNPEFDAAIAEGIPVFHRSEGLAHTMETKRVIAIAGTHGKTTTSSMAAVAFRHAGFEPTFAVGAPVAGLGTNAEAGNGEWFIAEADESDGSLLNYRPEIAVVTNIEADHLDYYGTEDAVHQVFRDFADLLPDDGLLIVCADDPGSAALAAYQRRRGEERNVAAVQTYGTATHIGNDLTLLSTQPNTSSTGQEATYQWADGTLSTVELAVPGIHNALNAAAVLLAARHAGMSIADAVAGLSHFSGSQRRFQHHGTVEEIRVFDDYAHHPTEVAAAIAAGRTVAAGCRVHVIFQPHLYTRTRDFAYEFAQALSAADTVRVLEIFPARETAIEGVHAGLITGQLAPELLRRYPHAEIIASAEQATESVSLIAAPGDIILTMGAGDINQQAPIIVDRLRHRYGTTL